jgi:serine/threonine-protein kinase
MSPEQAAGNPVDHRADVYSLGVIMYEMFTGKVPFEGDTYMGVLTQHLYVRPTPPSKIVPDKSLGALERVILHALEKRPEERFQSMEELEQALARVLRLGTADTTPAPESNGVRPTAMADELEPPTLEEIRESVAGLTEKKSRWPLGFMIAAVAIGAVIVSVAFLMRKPPAAEPAPVASAAPIESQPPKASTASDPPPVVPPPVSVAVSAKPAPTPRPIRTTPTRSASGEFRDPWK